MSQVASSSPDSPSPQPQQVTHHTQVIISSQTQILAAKVNMLCQIASQCQPPGPEYYPDGEGWKETQKKGFTGEAAVATEQTYCAAMIRLEKILNDDSQWGCVSTDQLLAGQMKEVNDMRLTAASEQAWREQEYNRPCYLFRCSLKRMRDNVWECRAPNNPDLFALGNSPAEAMDKFDILYHGKNTTE